MKECKHVWRPLQWFGRYPTVGSKQLKYKCASCGKEYDNK